MSFRVIAAILCLGLLPDSVPAQAVDMTGYRPLPGLVAVSDGGSLAVTWDGEEGQQLQARFSVVEGTPTLRELRVRKKGGEWTTLGKDLVPEFGVTTGVRRTRTRARPRAPLGRPLGRPIEPSRRGSPVKGYLPFGRLRGQDGRGEAGGLLLRDRDGVLLGGPAVHGLPGHQPVAAGGRRRDARTLCRLHLPGRAERVLLGGSPSGGLARRAGSNP
jgi:hypothetical protein